MACFVALVATLVRAFLPATAVQTAAQPAASIAPPFLEPRKSVFEILRTWFLGFTATVALIALAVALLAVIVEVKQDSITVDTFSVPPSFELQGYTGRVLAVRFIDELEDLSRAAEKELPRKRVAADWQRKAIDLPVPEMNTNLNAVVSVLRHLIGVDPQTFTCEIVDTGTFLRVRARLSNHQAFARDYAAGTRIDAIIGDLAMHFCTQSQPLVIAASYCGRPDSDAVAQTQCASRLNAIIHSARRVDAIWAFNLLGVRQEKTSFEAAIGSYTKAINFGCDGDFEGTETVCAVVYGNRGRAYRELFRTKEAIADLERARKLRPHDSVLLTNLGIAYEQAEDAQRALDAYTAACAAAPRRPLPLVHRGTLRAALNELDDAIEDFNRALRINPAFAPAYFHRAEVLQRREKREEAERDFLMSVYLDPRMQADVDRARGVLAAEMRP